MILNEGLTALLRTQRAAASCVPLWTCASGSRDLHTRSPFRPLLVSSRTPRRQPVLSCLNLPRVDFSSSAAPPSDPPAAPSPTTRDDASTLRVTMRHGLPQLTVPLPSRNEPCVFTLKPVTCSLGDFLSMLRQEDAGIDRAVARTPDGVRVAATTSIQTLLESEFSLVINDTAYRVIPPESITATAGTGLSGLSADEIQRLGDVRALVGQLYEALHVEEHQAMQETKLLGELEALKEELAPLEKQREEINLLAEKRTNQLTWLGLGMMSVQFGILARLTWWEYSWDIMEPGEFDNSRRLFEK